MLQLLFCITFILSTRSIGVSDCPRVHRAWHLISEVERNQYVDAVHTLNEQGKLEYFIKTHHYMIDQLQCHYTSAFFSWHRYFLFEFEEAVRSLGAEYECFTTPYWDLTYDANSWVLDEDVPSYIFRSGLGGVGDLSENMCVNKGSEGKWSAETYPLKDVCHSEVDPDDIASEGCCLKRAATGDGSQLSGTSNYVHFVKTYKEFGEIKGDDGFCHGFFLSYHGEAHGYVGGETVDWTHMISRYSPSDPTLWLLHVWIDYMYEIWKNCWGYNLIDEADLDLYVDAFKPYPDAKAMNWPVSTLDAELHYIPMNKESWWSGDINQPTTRKLYHAKSWDTSFEQGTFLDNSHLDKFCAFDWDPEVFPTNSHETLINIDSIEKTRHQLYEEKVWDLLEPIMDNDDDIDHLDITQTWSSKACNYARQINGKEPCYVPVTYGKCTEHDINDELGDIDLSLDDLLAKDGVQGNDCLEEVRNTMYAYAKSMRLLYQLCNGAFDQYHICESPIIDIRVEDDDDVYYNKMNAIKIRMDKEQNENDNKEEKEEEEEFVIIDNINTNRGYGKINEILYIIAGVFTIVVIFICVTKYYCCNTQAMKSKKSTATRYGSVGESI